jgi:hypothetical protein
MKLLLENWREYLNEEEFQPATEEAVEDDIDNFLNKIGKTRDDVNIIRGEEITDPTVIKDLAKQAMAQGDIQDDMITKIGAEGVIKKPVIIDKGTTLRIVDGKHRFIAAEKYNLNLPVVYISAKI